MERRLRPVFPGLQSLGNALALLFAVPPLSLAMLIGYTLLLTQLVDAVGPLAVHDPLNLVLFLSLVGVFLRSAVRPVVISTGSRSCLGRSQSWPWV